jgi:hypothetical protein
VKLFIVLLVNLGVDELLAPLPTPKLVPQAVPLPLLLPDMVELPLPQSAPRSPVPVQPVPLPLLPVEAVAPVELDQLGPQVN